VARSDVIVVGASAGGLEALCALVEGLPADLPAAVLVVLHLAPSSPDILPHILSRSGPIPAHTAVDGEPISPGRIYVAPPDQHMQVIDDRIRLSRGSSENGHRPAIDPLFRSAARAFGPRVVGVVLSGSQDDGASGLAAIAAGGGVWVVQEPGDALHPSMPRAALEHVAGGHITAAGQMGGLLTRITAQPRPDSTDRPPGAWVDQRRARHAWLPPRLPEAEASVLEGALWIALRALEDRAALHRRMAASSAERGSTRSTVRFEDTAEDADHAGASIRDLIEWIRADGVNDGARVVR
jgi:two-component system chemotaxis response regulator CheB